MAILSPPPVFSCSSRRTIDFVGVGLELLEGERLHLLHELVHADPLGERGIDVHRLARDPLALVGAFDVVKRAHVVQPVGELDQQHADVVRHRKQELAQVFRRPLALGLRLDLAELGDAVDQPRDVGAEDALDLLRGRHRVLHRVVKDRGGDRLVVEMQVGQDARHLDRVTEIRVTRRPFLRTMRVQREYIGAVKQSLVGLRIVVEDPIDQLVLPQHATFNAVRTYGNAT